MFDLDYEKERHIPEPDLVPILDALTCVIFFLVLSTTFIELTKVTIPPSKTSVITDPLRPAPVGGKILVHKLSSEKNLSIELKWSGESPDVLTEKVSAAKGDKKLNKAIEDTAEKIVKNFLEKYPAEKSIQLGFDKAINYQQMISVMDGVRKKIQDIVLISYDEVN